MADHWIKRWLLWPLRLLKAAGVWLLALILIFEEWGWEPLSRVLARIGQWPGFRWIEGRIKQLPPYAALALFVVPALALLPIKLLALYWLSHGHKILGIGLILAAKIGGTAITARLFMLTQATLMQLAWFARWFTRWINWKNSLMDRVRSCAIWHALNQVRAAIRRRVKQLISALQNLFRQN